MPPMRIPSRMKNRVRRSLDPESIPIQLHPWYVRAESNFAHVAPPVEMCGLTLPTEVVSEIARHLDDCDRRSLSKTCSALHARVPLTDPCKLLMYTQDELSLERTGGCPEPLRRTCMALRRLCPASATDVACDHLLRGRWIMTCDSSPLPLDADAMMRESQDKMMMALCVYSGTKRRGLRLRWPRVRMIVRHHFVPDESTDRRHMFKFVVLAVALVREMKAQVLSYQIEVDSLEDLRVFRLSAEQQSIANECVTVTKESSQQFEYRFVIGISGNSFGRDYFTVGKRLARTVFKDMPLHTATVVDGALYLTYGNSWFQNYGDVKA